MAETSNHSYDPAISVVSPFYNRADYLAVIVESLERQTFRDFELIIADDGSSDDLQGAVARLRASFPVRYLRAEENCGAASARNRGIEAARGRYIALLDSDDSWAPQKLQSQFEHLENAGESSLVSLTRQQVRGRNSFVAPHRLMQPGDDVGSYIFLKGGIIQSSMMFLSADLAKAVRFEEGSKRHDDWSFALRLQQAGARFQMLEEPLTIYNDEPGRVRRSPTYTASRLEWLNQWREQLGEAPYLAASAMVASHLRRDRDVRTLGLIANAWRQGAIGPARAAYYALVWAIPPLRQVASGAWQLWAGRKRKTASSAEAVL
jgi:glycosyltransferase involved in cell wall biosynthesis